MSVYFKTSKKKTLIDLDKISEEIIHKQTVEKFALNFKLNQG